VTKIKKTLTVIFRRTDKLTCLPSHNRPSKTQRKLKATVNRCS